MKFLQVILSLFLLLLLVVESSSLNDTSVTNITRGSSLSMNDASPYWLSPSGNIAFGFYQLPWSPNQYTVGIWFVKSSHKTLVWTANHKDLIPVVHKPSSIFFTREGKLVLRMLPDNREKPLLPDAPETVSYAKLHDNGNFVLYGSDSQIVWESFDYPTDTLLGGQKLKLGGADHLISNSGEYKISIYKAEGAVIISNAYDEFQARISGEPWFGRPATPPASLSLNTAGMLYIVDSNGAIFEILYEDKNVQRKPEDGTSKNVNEDYVYRATLDSRGDFILYKERIDGNEESSSSLELLWASYQWNKSTILAVSLVIFLIGVLILVIVKVVVEENKGPEEMETPKKSWKGGYQKVAVDQLSDLELGGK